MLAQAGVEVCITDPDISEPVPLGEIGMIKVCGPNVFQGYWRMLEKTNEELRAKGSILTADIGKIDADGYVEIVGRSKDLTISGDHNICLKEIKTEID